VIGFILGLMLTILIVLGLALVGQVMVGDPDDVVPEENGT